MNPDTLFRPYQGGFVSGDSDDDGLPHGYVEFIYDQVLYRGNMSHGNEDGYGYLKFRNGFTFHGLFHNGNTVRGVLKKPNGQLLYEGDYHIHFGFHGFGKQHLPDGSFLTGYFHRGKMKTKSISPGEFVWICDFCNKAKFPTFEDAVEHENSCSDRFHS